jgi:hypothetical protein
MATLSSYITETRRLLHDANGNFYSDPELTDYINSARKRVVRDTGCLRTIQITQTPLAPVATATQPVAWTANTPVTQGQYLYSNIFIYEVTVAGTTGDSSPPYPAANVMYPPSAPFTSGTATLQYVGDVEKMNYVALPQGTNTFDVVNMNLYWGNSRVPLQYLPWTQFNAQLRYWQNYIGRPIAFSIFGQSTIYLSPVPDQIYTVEIDTIILPQDLALATSTTPDVIIDPYTSPVAFYAAYKAKYKEQSYGEAEIYKQEYIKQVQAVLTSVMTRRLPDAYSTPF